MKQGALLRDLELVLDGLAGLVGLALLVVLGLPLARLPCVKETIKTSFGSYILDGQTTVVSFFKIEGW